MINLITDRTESDSLLGNEKGIYSYTDLNRVESTVQELSLMIKALGSSVVLKTKTDWGLPGDFSVSSWPVASQMERYLGNIHTIRNTLYIQTALPVNMEKLNWNSANNIEKVLQTAYSRIEAIKQTYRYSGEIFAGGGIL